MAIPIRRLPILVIQLILQTMGVLDLFLLTRTSTIMKRIVKNMHGTQKHYMFVTVSGEDIEILIQSMTNDEYFEVINAKAEEDKPHRRYVFNMRVGSVDRLPSARYMQDDGLQGVSTYWNDIKVGCIELCNELVEVFRTPVRGVTLELENIENCQNEINWVNSTFPGLILFIINGKCSSQDYIWMIKNTRAEELTFNMEPTDSEYSDEMKNFEIVPMELEEFVIKHGRWVSLQRLQAIKARFISIQDVDSSDSQFNEFFRNLKSSKEKAKFNELNIYFPGEADLNVVLEGLISEEEGASKLEDIAHGFVLKTGNGQKCTIVSVELENDQPDVHIFGFEIKIED